MEREELSGDIPGGGVEVSRAIEDKILSDLGDLGNAILDCRRCPGGGRGIPGSGEPGAGLFLLAGRPGPGASPENPWGAWWDELLREKIEDRGWSVDGVYLSTALRCPLKKATPAELRRCSRFLAHELFLIGPRLVVVSGKLAAVTLRAALGDEIPGKPRAGDVCRLFSSQFLFELDVARIKKEKEAARVFWSVLLKAEELLE